MLCLTCVYAVLLLSILFHLSVLLRLSHVSPVSAVLHLCCVSHMYVLSHLYQCLSPRSVLCAVVAGPGTGGPGSPWVAVTETGQPS